MNPVVVRAFCDELEKISMDKESILGPRQALQIAGGVRGLLRSAGKKIGLKGATKARATVPAAAPKMVDPTVIKAQTEAALKANPKLQAATKQFPQSTKATELRGGYSLTPAKSTAVGRRSAQMPVPKGATPTAVGGATAVGSAVSRTPPPSIDAMMSAAGRTPGLKHGPFRPPRSISARQLRRGQSLPQRVG